MFFFIEFFDGNHGDHSTGFGGLSGRGRKKQDPSIERDLVLSLEEIFHGCTKKMKISRRVRKHLFELISILTVVKLKEGLRVGHKKFR